MTLYEWVDFFIGDAGVLPLIVAPFLLFYLLWSIRFGPEENGVSKDM
jgi:hypothetical protein